MVSRTSEGTSARTLKGFAGGESMRRELRAELGRVRLGDFRVAKELGDDGVHAFIGRALCVCACAGHFF